MDASHPNKGFMSRLGNFSSLRNLKDLFPSVLEAGKQTKVAGESLTATPPTQRLLLPAHLAMPTRTSMHCSPHHALRDQQPTVLCSLCSVG